MTLLTSLISAGVAVVLGALVARRGVAERVASRQVGTPVKLVTLHSVLDIGDGIWRGPAPTPTGYQELADAGCSLVVDLRAEADLDEITQGAAAAGLDLLVLPTENTRTPNEHHVSQLAAALESTAGATYVHCQAGEGRTGAILGAYQVRNGANARRAMADALAVGSLTFAQLSYIACAARAPLLVEVIDLGIDRPTEAAFELLARGR